MTRKWTKRQCFDHYGVKPRNIRWSWCGRSDDGKTVAVQFWKDRFTAGGRVYESSSHAGDEKWFGSPGHNELIENLIHARDNCDGVLRVIIGIAKDERAEPRETKECYPQDKMLMKIVYLDEATREFRVERIG
jgi:hypothetical protein